MTLYNPPMFTSDVVSLARAHPPHPPCACASDARRGCVARARARATARASEVCEQPRHPREEGLRATGAGTQRAGITPCNPSTLASSIRATQGHGSAHRPGVAARVRTVCAVLAHVASLAPGWPTYPPAARARLGRTVGKCQSGRYLRGGMVPPWRSSAGDGRGNATLRRLSLFYEREPRNPRKETRHGDED